MMNLYWIIGLQVLWSGVITAGKVTAAPGDGTTTSNEISAFIISIKITNHIFDDSLEDHQSQNYKILRQEVENVFFEIYNFTPSVQYQEIADMTFSNGSVIAKSTVIFGSKQKNGEMVKQVFVHNYVQHRSLKLDLNINYTADQEPFPVQLSLLANSSDSTSSMETPITSPNIQTPQRDDDSAIISTTSASTISGPDKSKDNDNSTTSPPQTHPITKGSNFTYTSTQITLEHTSDKSNITAPTTIFTPSRSATSLLNMSEPTSSSPLNTTTHPSSNISTTSASNSSTTTEHPSSNISTTSVSSSSPKAEYQSSSISASSPLSTITHPSTNVSTTSASSSSTTTEQPSSNISTTSSSSSSTSTTHPSSNISATSVSSSSESPGKTVTQKPTGPEGTDTVATVQGVPGWGIAILVLAAIILFFMLVLLILLLLFWCCWWKQRGFMHVSDPDPTGYYNPDIPMYSTHSTYDSHNGKSLDSDSERPHKNRTGMYTVNK